MNHTMIRTIAVPTYRIMSISGVTYKEIKEVPGEVVNVEAQPLGPDSKEQEEYETSHNEDQVNIHFQVALLNHEHVEASGADLLLSAHFNLLGLLSFRTVRVCIHILCRLDFPKYFQLHQGETKLHRVLNLLEVIELASLLNLLAHGEDFVFVSEDRKVQIRAYTQTHRFKFDLPLWYAALKVLAIF